jgi:alpha-1,3-rhamnosyltransferase
VPNTEIIALDDGSPDNSADMLEELAKQSPVPMRVIRQANSGNVPANFNKLLKASRGKYVSMMSCDDIIADNSLLPKVQAMQANENMVLAYSDSFININEEGAFISKEFCVATKYFAKNATDLFNSEYNHIGTCWLQGNLLRKATIDAIGGFEEGMLGDDIVIFTKLFLYMMKNPQLTFTETQGIGVLYRMHENNIHKNIFRQIKTVVQVIDRYFPDRPLPELLIGWIRYGFIELPYKEASKIVTLSPKVRDAISNRTLLLTKLKKSKKLLFGLLSAYFVISVCLFIVLYFKYL